MIIFFHLVKAGGTTFNNILKNNFGPRAVRVYGENRHGFYFSDYALQGIVDAHYEKALSLSSHAFSYPLPSPSVLNTGKTIDYHYVTFLRHPIDRALSWYRHERKLNSNSPSHPSQRSFEEWLRITAKQDYFVPNFQTWCLCGGSETNLERVKENLAHFTLVGLVEYYNESLKLCSFE